MKQVPLELTPLGGVGEFGMNMLFLRHGRSALVIDAGLMFPDEELLGVDIIVPDITYLRENRDDLQAILLTHGHEDHIGALPFVLPEINVPVYGTAFTLALVRRKLEEHHLLESAQLVEIRPGEKITAGAFEVEFIQVTHSIVDAVALAIRTPLGVLIHTGDFKIDPTPMDQKSFDAQAFERYGREGVLALLSDSTNVERAGQTPSERAVLTKLDEIFRATCGAVILSCFTTSIHRLQIVMDLAARYGRKICFLGRSMLEVFETATQLGLLRYSPDLCFRPETDGNWPRHQCVYIATGSQGEPLAALARMAIDEHKYVRVERGDTVVISARMIPGNERAILRMVNHFYKRGAEVHYDDGSRPPIHVSGHASAEELKWMLETTRPKFFFPVHGEYRQLFRHAQLAEEQGAVRAKTLVIESGDRVLIDGDRAKVAGRVPVGRVCIDEGSLDAVDELVVRDRRHLSEDGIVLPILAINKHTGEMESEPEIVARGFVMSDQFENLMDSAREVILKTVESSNQEEKTDWTVMKEKIRRDLKKFLFRETQKRPMILPVILEI